jgi:type IV secretion system protein VirB10
VLAQVAFDVFDSQTHHRRLIPRGARLIGAYQSAVSSGQNRLQLTFSKLVMLDGQEVALENLVATDTQGFSGLSDQTNNHNLQVLSDAALASLMGVGAELNDGGQGGQIARAIRRSAAQGAQDEAQMLMRRNLELKPTLTVRPGWPFRLVLPSALALPEQP